MALIIKCVPEMATRGAILVVSEMPYENPTVSLDDIAFVWFAETAGGSGLAMRGRIEAAERAGERINLRIRVLDQSTRVLTKETLEPHRDVVSMDPLSGLARKLYRHAHNKIAELSDSEATFLEGFFSLGS